MLKMSTFFSRNTVKVRSLTYINWARRLHSRFKEEGTINCKWGKIRIPLNQKGGKTPLGLMWHTRWLGAEEHCFRCLA